MAKKVDLQSEAETSDNASALSSEAPVTALDGAPVTHEGGAPDATGSAEPVANNPPATARDAETQKSQGQDAGELSALPATAIHAGDVKFGTITAGSILSNAQGLVSDTANVADRTDAILKEMLGVSDQPETQRFFLAGAVRLNGTLHEQGASIRLTETEHGELLALGVIDEEWD